MNAKLTFDTEADFLLESETTENHAASAFPIQHTLMLTLGEPETEENSDNNPDNSNKAFQALYMALAGFSYAEIAAFLERERYEVEALIRYVQAEIVRQIPQNYPIYQVRNTPSGG